MSPFTIFIIFGFAGDLAKRKLIPGLYRLLHDKKIDRFAVIGAGLENKSLQDIFNDAYQFITKYDEQDWQQLMRLTHYCQLDSNKTEEFTKLQELIQQLEQQYNVQSCRLFYCATPANAFVSITKNLVDAGLLKPMQNNTPWHRIAYEKPFGENFATAQAMNNEILSILDESQIYRVDHYLAKEVVENITYVRFTNHVFEALWDNHHIDAVHINLSEQLGVGTRGAYYDAYGALRDVVQNHMLQLLALVAMNTPKQLTGDYIRDCKASVLQQVEVTDGFFGQYKGYQQEQQVQPNSTTETFAALRLLVHDARWQDVPFYLVTGKYLARKETKIHIRFSHVECRLVRGCPLLRNYLTITVYPDGGLSFEVNVKKPAVRDEIIPVTMDYCYDCITSTPEAYELIFQDIMLGERAVSVRRDEIELCWRIIDQVRAMKLPLYTYEKGSNGPEEVLAAFARQYGLDGDKL